MKCEDIVLKDSNRCTYYISGGMCTKDGRFRCEEYIRQKEPILSYSGINTFMKCPRKYYLSSICGIKMKEEFISPAAKIGIAVDGYLTRNVMPSTGEIITLAEAKISAMCDVLMVLIDVKRINELYTGQKEILWEEDGYPKILCKIDLEYKDGTKFVEIKCTSRPAFYTTYFMHDQLATYFLANSKYEECSVWLFRVPELRQGAKETIEQFTNRCVNDMMSRPSWYINDYIDKHTFGMEYYRNDFDLEAIKKRSCQIAKHIVEATNENYWYQDRTQCLFPGQCDYLSICDTGGVSKDLYEMREKEGGEKITTKITTM